MLGTKGRTLDRDGGSRASTPRVSDAIRTPTLNKGTHNYFPVLQLTALTQHSGQRMASYLCI